MPVTDPPTREGANAEKPLPDVQNGFGIYFHWPYCTRICPYCDFNVIRARHVDHGAWTRAFLAELDHWAQHTGERSVTSIYFGGGTPSLMPPQMLDRVINQCDKRWRGVRSAEITLEVNPTTAEAHNIAAFCAAGVNRLSLGVQSFNTRQLSFLGRNNTVKENYNAIDAAQKFASAFSLDLIYGVPEQTEMQLDKELDAALEIGAPHLSFYQLTIEPGTAFHRAVTRGSFTPIKDDVEAILYDHIAQRTKAAGYRAYEVSNHALPGYQSHHNQLYWRYMPYLGIGPGAHGRMIQAQEDRPICATYATKNPRTWLESPPEGRTRITALSQEEIAREIVLMGLRLDSGVDLSRLKVLSGHTLDEGTCATLLKEGMARQTGTHFMLTGQGRKLLNYYAEKLIF